jgi:hypothetical protein
MALGCRSCATNASSHALSPSCALLSTTSHSLTHPNSVSLDASARAQLAMLARVGYVARLPGVRRCERSFLSSLRSVCSAFIVWSVLINIHRFVTLKISTEIRIRVYGSFASLIFLNWVHIQSHVLYELGLEFFEIGLLDIQILEFTFRNSNWRD